MGNKTGGLDLKLKKPLEGGRGECVCGGEKEKKGKGREGLAHKSRRRDGRMGGGGGRRC